MIKTQGIENKIRSKVSSKKYCLQFLPKRMQTFVATEFVEYQGKKLKTAYLIDIVHNLILKYYFKKENSYNLLAILLKEKYGHLYNFYMDFLQDQKVIELIKKHLKGKNSRVYKLEDSILIDEITRFQNYDKVLLKKYKNAVAKVEENDLESNLILPEVKQKLVQDLFCINIRLDQAIEFLNFTTQDLDIYNRNLYSVECIDEKQIFYHFDCYGRMHTNFTILKSYIRKNCLMIDGESTFEIDISNSQPLFLCKVMEEENFRGIDLDEFQLYQKLTIMGAFYTYLMDNSGIQKKSEIKDLVYKVYFGKNHSNSRADKIFKSIFPTIHNFIKNFKKEKGDYRLLAHRLQNLESNLIFNKIIKEMAYIYPEVKLVTCHDSIICAEKYKDVLTSTFQKNFLKEFQLNF